MILCTEYIFMWMQIKTLSCAFLSIFSSLINLQWSYYNSKEKDIIIFDLLWVCLTQLKVTGFFVLHFKIYVFEFKLINNRLYFYFYVKVNILVYPRNIIYYIPYYYLLSKTRKNPLSSCFVSPSRLFASFPKQVNFGHSDNPNERNLPHYFLALISRSTLLFGVYGQYKYSKKWTFFIKVLSGYLTHVHMLLCIYIQSYMYILLLICWKSFPWCFSI